MLLPILSKGDQYLSIKHEYTDQYSILFPKYTYFHCIQTHFYYFSPELLKKTVLKFMCMCNYRVFIINSY